MEKQHTRSRFLNAIGIIAVTLIGSFAQVEFEKMDLKGALILLLRISPFAVLIYLIAHWVYKELKWKLEELMLTQQESVNRQFEVAKEVFTLIDNRFVLIDVQMSVLAAQHAYRLQERIIFQDDGSLITRGHIKMKWDEFLKKEIVFARAHLRGLHKNLTNQQIEDTLKAIYKDNYKE